MSFYRTSEAAHWYQADGTPCHTQPDGKPTTLRHARKQNLLPSVTNVMKLLHKPVIEDWRVEQAILTTAVEPRQPGEPDEQFIMRVVDVLGVRMDAAKKFGNEIHKAIEYVNTEGALPSALSEVGRLHMLHIAHYFDWFRQNVAEVCSVEQTVVNVAQGYAGRLDLRCIHKAHGPCIVDFKTQAVRERGPQFYDEWVYQLAPYRRCGMADWKCLSLVIDSAKPSAPTEYLWTAEEADHGWEVFAALLALWQQVKKYKPTQTT